MTFPPPSPAPGQGPPSLGREPGTAPEPASWIAQAPVERGTLPAAALLWTAAEVMHWTGVSGIWPAIAGMITAGWAYSRITRHQRMLARRVKGREPMKRHHGADAAGTVLAATAWTAAATYLGPLAGPWAPLSLAWAVISFGGYWWLRRHEGVRHARHWRHRKRTWLSEAHGYGLGGAHMIRHELTGLGEAFELDTTQTGQLASSLAAGNLAERIAQTRQLAPSRVRVTKGAIAGRLRIAIREADPWAAPVLHPLLNPASKISLPVPCSIRDAAIVGTDPETGEPLTLTLYDEAGGKRILVMGTTRFAGKTVLLSDIRERVTACEDAILIDINLDKAIEDLAWAPACHLTAIGIEQAGRAARIMQQAVKIKNARPRLRDTAVFQPTREHPAIVIVIDEVDVASPYIRGLLRELCSKSGSEGITVIMAGQRGTAEWLGGGDIRALLDTYAVGAVSRESEQGLAAGNLGLAMPDMSAYGEGARGVWAIAGLGSPVPVTGRSFLLSEPPDIRAIAHSRAHWQPGLEPELTAVLGDDYETLLASDVYASWAVTDKGREWRAAPRPGQSTHAVIKT